MKKDKFGQEFKVGCYFVRPTKYGASRVNEVNVMVGETNKTIKFQEPKKDDLTGMDCRWRPAGTTNYDQCVIIEDQLVLEYLHNK